MSGRCITTKVVLLRNAGCLRRRRVPGILVGARPLTSWDERRHSWKAKELCCYSQYVQIGLLPTELCGPKVWGAVYNTNL